MELYAGTDLHSNNILLGIRDGNDKRINKKCLPNRADIILAELEPLIFSCNYKFLERTAKRR